MRELAEFTGILNGLILAFLILGFIARLIYKKYGKQYPLLKKFLLFTKKYHRYLGFVFIVVAPIHGYLALGRISLHTGTLLYLSILVMFLLYLLGKAKLLKKWVVLHRTWAFVVVGLFFIHYLWPWLI